MNWIVAALWAVLTGVAAGINPDWQSVITRQFGGGAQATPRAEKEAKTASKPSNTAPADGAPQVNVDVPRREGEFSSGVAFVGGPRIPRSEPPQRGEGRRKRRIQPEKAPADPLCARCKAAIEHELQQPVDVADLARTQEAETEGGATDDPLKKDAETTAGEAPASDPEVHAEPRGEGNAPIAEEHSRPRGPIQGRVATRLATRGALTRLVERATTEQATGG
jgi:hypothetical protein